MEIEKLRSQSGASDVYDVQNTKDDVHDLFFLIRHHVSWKISSEELKGDRYEMKIMEFCRPALNGNIAEEDIVHAWFVIILFQILSRLRSAFHSAVHAIGRRDCSWVDKRSRMDE